MKANPRVSNIAPSPSAYSRKHSRALIVMILLAAVGGFTVRGGWRRLWEGRGSAPRYSVEAGGAVRDGEVAAGQNIVVDFSGVDIAIPVPASAVWVEKAVQDEEAVEVKASFVSRDSDGRSMEYAATELVRMRGEAFDDDCFWAFGGILKEIFAEDAADASPSERAGSHTRPSIVEDDGEAFTITLVNETAQEGGGKFAFFLLESYCVVRERLVRLTIATPHDPDMQAPVVVNTMRQWRTAILAANEG